MKHGDRRKAQILETGLQLWRQGAASVSARQIAKSLGITHTAVLYHWKTADALKNAIAEYAVRQRDPQVVPMLIVHRHPSIDLMPVDERAKFLSRL